MSNNKRFSSLLSAIIPDLICVISEKKHISEEDALALLYSSRLYSLLEQEETKVWHYSTETLYCMLDDEITYGKIECPEN